MEFGNQQAAAAEEARQSDSAQGVPPNFNEMTEQEQYDYLRKVTIEQAGGDESAWKIGEDEVNLVGIRSWQGGQAGSTEGNTYNDTIYAVRMHDGQPEVYGFEGSVDAGVMGGNPNGFGRMTSEGLRFSHLADGYYEDGTFVETTSDTWGGRMVLGQGKDVRINVDLNNDGVIQSSERWNETQGTNWQINFHPGGSGDQVGEMSAGCQIIRPAQYDLFERLLREDPDWTHGYTLIDSANLPLR